MQKIFSVLALMILLFTVITGCSQDQPVTQPPQTNVQAQDENDTGPAAASPEALYLRPPQQDAAIGDMLNKKIDTYYFKHSSAAKAADILKKLFPEDDFSEGTGASLLLIKCRVPERESIFKTIRSLDSAPAQIMIESKVVEISESGLSDLGITWGNTAGNLKVNIDTGTGKISSDNIAASIQALASNGKASVLSDPKIATIDNQEACVNIGSKIPYAVPVTYASAPTQWAVQYIDAGVSLKITPRLETEGQIDVKIMPEVSSVSEWRSTQAGEFPVISTRNAQTSVRVKNGDTIVIGGLIDETERKNFSRIPGAGDIPLLSRLFGNSTSEKERTEIIFMITPHVM